jgi:hypothetical protein
MATDPQSKPSFSPYRKWSIGFNVVLIVLIVFSVVGMINYLSRDYFFRLHWSSRGKVELSPLTIKFLRSLTNQIKVTVYYDRDEPLFTTVTALLNEYRLVNPRIAIEMVDYLRDPAAAQKTKEHYKLSAATDRNLVIFECEGRQNTVPGDALAKYVTEQVPNENRPEFRRKPTEFFGEKWFTSALLAVTNPKPLNAYALTGHGEHGIDSTDPTYGYLKFSALLRQDWIRVEPASLLGTNLPADCNLLVIAGPRSAFFPEELEKIDQYLAQGGRLLALFNAHTHDKDLGLEGVLAKWGIAVGHNIIADTNHSAMGADVVVTDFSSHPIVNPLLNSAVDLIRPRSISKSQPRTQAADAPAVEEIIFSNPSAVARVTALGEVPRQGRFPFAVAAEKSTPKGVVTERAGCRIVVLGDSIFLGNSSIESVLNRDFARYAVNWLLNRTQLLEEIGPRPFLEYKLVMTRAQLQQTQWLLLGAMPGAVLLLGTLVWFRRRR